MSALLPRSFLTTVVAVLGLMGWAVLVEVAKSGETPPPAPDILVKFVAGTSTSERSKLEAENGLTLLRHFASIDVFHYRIRTADPEPLVAKLGKNPLVVYAEMDQKHRALPSEDKVKAAEP